MSSSSRLSPTQRSTSPTLTSNNASVTSGAADNKDICQSRIPQTTAFTVHFDNDNKFTKRHVRNLSLPISKLYDGKMTSDPNKSPAAVNGRTPDGIRNGLSVGAASRISRGNHSEGYFSSDAEAEDDPAHPKLFVAKLRTTGKKVCKPTNLAQEKKVEQQRRVTTPIVKDDQDIVLKRNVKQKPIEPMEPDEDADGGDSSDAASEVSEAGTYTIDKEKERENVDVITARLNIDNSFGVSQQTITANQDPDPNNFDSAHSSLSWVNDWASHVVEHNSLTLTGVQEQDHVTAVSPVQQKQPVPIHGGPISKIPSPISNVRAQFRLTNTGTTLPPIERTSLNPATINKQSPRSRRTTVQTTNTNITNRQSHRDEYSDSSLETESFLLATERVVSAMAARVSLSMDSGGESDVDTSHSCNSKRQIGSHSISMPASTLVTPTAASGGIQSDSSASESGGTSRKAVINAPTSTPSSITTPTTTTRYNRAFSLRRGRLDKVTPTGTGTSNILIGGHSDSPVGTKLKRTPDTQRHSTASSSLTQQSHAGASTGSRLSKTASGGIPLSRSSSTVSHTLSTSAANVPHRSQSFTRTDCGRYSMRSVKPNQTNSPLLSNQNKDVKKKGSGARSNSTLSSREVEFQNWKRRKSYDPMKAAAEGKKKEAAKKQQQSTTGGNAMISSSSSQPKTPSNPVLRSASFHGTRQLAIPSSSDEDDECEEEEEEEEGEDEEVVPSAEEYEEEEEDWKAPAAPRTSLESTPRGSHVSLYSNTSNSSLRSRPKLENNIALRYRSIGVDNLVISALSGLSGKVKVGSCNLLKKLRHLYDEDNPKAHQLTAEIEQLEVSEPGSPHHAAAAANNNSNTTSNANRSPSRELSTALRNLKRIESVIKVLDNVLFDNEDFN